MLQIRLQRVFNSGYFWLLLLWAGRHGVSGSRCLLQSLLLRVGGHMPCFWVFWEHFFCLFCCSLFLLGLLNDKAWCFPHLSCLALPFLLELEGLFCSVISFLVNFFTFSFPADTEANGGYRVFSRPYSLATLLASSRVWVVRRMFCFSLSYMECFLKVCY